jgi:hypothetical protein
MCFNDAVFSVEMMMMVMPVTSLRSACFSSFHSFPLLHPVGQFIACSMILKHVREGKK